MSTIDDSCSEPLLPTGLEPIIDSSSSIRCALQRASENIDLTRKKLADMDESKYKPEDYQNYQTQVAGLIQDLDDYKSERDYLIGKLRSTG